jgi:hypothetical protein
MAAPHLFRFYGARPSHWLDDQLAYELAFVEPPTPEQKLALARAVAESCADSHLAFASKWLWSSRFALFVLDNFARGLVRHFRDEIPPLMRALHAAAPLEQVVFFGVEDAGDDWTEWSVAEQEEPTHGPRWGHHASSWAFCGQFSGDYPDDRADAPSAFDEPFERACGLFFEEREKDDMGRETKQPPAGAADPSAPLEPTTAARALRKYLSAYIEYRGGFLDEWGDAGEDDKAALELGNATPWKNEPKISLAFRCAPDLAADAAPVTEWIEECVKAAREAHPNAFAAAEVVVACFVSHDPLEPL